MQQTIKERIRALRMMLKSEAISAFIIPSTDPHLSEYVASYWKTREWISGFTGSAGTIVILKDKAGLWTDSRYFLQAAQQLEGTDITLYKEMLPETPTIIEFICQNLLPGETVGIDGKMFSANQVEQMKQKLETANVHLKDYGDLPGKIWNNRPDMPDAPTFIYDLKYAGKSCEEKIASIRTEIQKQGTDGLFISALDEIAWTLNLRGSDVHCNPVIISYLLITQNNITFFVSPQKITEEIKNYLEEQQVSIQPYSETEDYLRKLNIKSISLNPNQTNYAIYSAINPACRINHCNSPITLLKAIRNEQEIAGIHAAMRRDGIALVRFLKWLEEAVVSEKETELSIDQNYMNIGLLKRYIWEKASIQLPDTGNMPLLYTTPQHQIPTLFYIRKVFYS